MLLCRSIPPRAISNRHIQQGCKTVGVMGCVIVGDVATFVVVVVVVVVATFVVAAVVVVNCSLFCVGEPITGLILPMYSSYVNRSKFRIEGLPITRLLLIYSSYASKSPIPGALASK